MRDRTSRTCRGRGLRLWAVLGSGFVTRDLWLAAHGGGATPGWLLCAETASFGLSVLAALVGSRPRAFAADTRALEIAATTAGVVAGIVHGVRVVVYLRSDGS